MEVELVYLPDSNEWKVTTTIDDVLLRSSDRAALRDLLRRGRGVVEHDADRKWIGSLIARSAGTFKPTHG